MFALTESLGWVIEPPAYIRVPVHLEHSPFVLTVLISTASDLGRNHFDRRSSDQQKNRLVKRLAELGYAVEIKPLATTA